MGCYKSRLMALLVVVMVATACSGSAEPGAGDSTTGSTTGEGVTPQPDDVVANLVPIDPDALGELPSSPPTPELSGFTEADWDAVFADGDVELIRERLIELVLSGGSSGPTSSADPARRRAAAPGATIRAVPYFEIETRSENQTWEVDNGTRSGEVTANSEISYDTETSKQTASLTFTGDVTDTATGESIPVGLDLEMSADLCWDENGDRGGEFELTTTMPNESGEPVTESTSSAITAHSDGTATVDWGKTVDGNGVKVLGTFPDGMGPSDNAPTVSSSDDATTYVYDNGFTMETSGTDQATIDRLVTEMSYENPETASQVSFGAPPDPGNEGPGSSAYCLRVSADPASAVIEPDGETLGLTVSVTDWNGTPLPDAIVTMSGVDLGVYTGPTEGFSDHNGELATLYTSDQPGSEDVYVDVYYSMFNSFDVRSVIQIGETWTFAMTVDVENVTFLWDGLFVAGGGWLEGTGIGTVLGSGTCVVNGVEGPPAGVAGGFTFDLAGTIEDDDGAEFFSLLIDSTEAEIEFSNEDPRCGGFFDIAGDFLSQVPTFPSFIPNIEVQVSDGFGIVDLAMDPYIFELEISRLGE